VAWGHQLQHRVATAEPDAEQLRGRRGGAGACLALESPVADTMVLTPSRHGRRLPPEIFDLPVDKYVGRATYTDAYFTTRDRSWLADGGHPRVSCRYSR
jgi:hypothetical protein